MRKPSALARNGSRIDYGFVLAGPERHAFGKAGTKSSHRRGSARAGGGTILALLACAAAPGPVGAARQKPADPVALAAMQAFSRCVADRDARGAEAVLALDDRTKAHHQALKRLAQSKAQCILLTARLKFNGLLFAGGLAERLLENRGEQAELARRVAYETGRPPVQARDEDDMMALCTVRAAPVAVASLFAAEPGSAAEGAVVRTLGPTVTNCVAAGRTMLMNRPGLRAMLALAAWRLVRQNETGAAPVAGA
jgi:hypothetical protein